MRSMLFAAVFAILAGCAFAAEPATASAPTADQIMAKVAANQDRTEAARTRYIYLQHIRAVSRKTNGRVMCEEITDSRVSPRTKGSHQDLLKLDGRAWQKNHYIHYATLQDQETAEHKDKQAKSEQEDLDGIDVDLVENLRKKTPLTTVLQTQKKKAHEAKLVSMLMLPTRGSRRTGWRKDSFRSRASDSRIIFFSSRAGSR